MGKFEPKWIGDWMACMADAAVESAEVLDDFNRHEREQFLRLAKAAGWCCCAARCERGIRP